MRRAETYDPGAIPDDVRRWWIETVDKSSVLDSPYFRPEFAQIIGSHRSDARVAVVSSGGKTEAILAFHQKPGGVGAPIGGPISDYQGVIAAPDFEMNASELLSLSALTAFDFNHALASQEIFSDHAYLKTLSPVMDLSAGYQAWRADRKKAGASDVKNAERKSRKVEREVGPINLVLNDERQAAWTNFTNWKNHAYDQMKKPSIFKTPWAAKVLEDIKASSGGEFAGLLTSLYAGDEMIAVHFGMRSKTAWHWWFPTYNPDFGKYSPGLILLNEMAKVCEETGIRKIDLGRGDERYKSAFSNAFVEICEGALIKPGSLPGTLRQMRNQSQRAVNALMPPRVADLHRRAFNKALGAGLI